MAAGAGYVRRSDVGRIVVTGADRRSYLQGLLTNDIEALTPGTGCYAAMLTAQGRMITDMYVDELGDSLLVRVPIELTTRILEHFDRFVFSEDVQVTDVTAKRIQVGVYGPLAAGAARHLPDAVRLALDDLPGAALIVDTDRARALTDALDAEGAIEATLDDLEVARSEAGVPRFGVDMDADTIPLEAGIEDRAISRTKGCYVGQEVIVRVLDRGHGRVAKRLVPLLFDEGAAAPAVNAAVHVGEREVGRVTSAVVSPRLRRVVALAFVHRDFTSPGTPLTIGGARATVRGE